MFKHNICAKLNNQRVDKQGKSALRVRATVKRVTSYYPTGIYLTPDQWNDEGQVIINHKNKALLNATLSQKLSEIEARFLEANLRGEQPLKLGTRGTADFITYCKKKIAKEHHRPTTIRQKLSALSKLEGFMPSIPFKSINKALINQYEDYCRSLGNKENTVWSSAKFVINMLNLAAEDGLFDKKKIQGYRKPKYTDPQRGFLTLAELDKIEKYRNKVSIDRLRHVCDWFLFSCYTGFRYGDIKAFLRSFISNGKLLVRTIKKDADVSISIHPRLQKVIDRMPEGVYSNEKCNEYLKVIAAGAGIDKHLTLHKGRHSFAVIFLELGGTLEDLKELLGHTKIATTEIYGKITNSRVNKAMADTWGRV